MYFDLIYGNALRFKDVQLNNRGIPEVWLDFEAGKPFKVIISGKIFNILFTLRRKDFHSNFHKTLIRSCLE